MRLKKATEADFQKQVTALARLNGWRVASFRKVRVQRANGSVYYETPVGADGTGWPDLVMTKGDRLIAWELKTDRGTSSPEQRQWMAALSAAGVTTAIVRPRDWDMIRRELEG